MNTLKSWAWMLATLSMACLLQAEQVAIVKKNRVNVRGQASQNSEVITQLRKGEAVVVLEEVEGRKPKKGEPIKWAKIQLPSNTPVWVFAPYVDASTKTVNSRRLNIRSGPGENFTIIGRLDRGASVKEIRTVDNSWMEIEAPTNAFAFVALDLLEKQAPTAPTLAVTTPEPAPVPPPTTTETVTTEPPPAQPTEPAPATTTATPPEPAVTTPAEPAPAEPAPPAEPPRRTVSREGIVIISRSIQSPTSFALESLETKRTINYLHSEDPAIKFKLFGGRKVIVTGEELLDQRWSKTPIIEVETIRLSP